MKSGANFADQNRIKRMITGEEVNVNGDPFTPEQIAALLRIQLPVVQSWCDHFLERDIPSYDSPEEEEEEDDGDSE